MKTLIRQTLGLALVLAMGGCVATPTVRKATPFEGVYAFDMEWLTETTGMDPKTWGFERRELIIHGTDVFERMTATASGKEITGYEGKIIDCSDRFAAYEHNPFGMKTIKTLYLDQDQNLHSDGGVFRRTSNKGYALPCSKEPKEPKLVMRGLYAGRLDPETNRTDKTETPIGIGTPLAGRPSHTTDRTDRVISGSAATARDDRAEQGRASE